MYVVCSDSKSGKKLYNCVLIFSRTFKCKTWHISQ